MKTMAHSGLLVLRDIEKSFFGNRVLKGVSITVSAGRVVGLVGENGAGKSTLMNVLGGNLRPDAGEILLSGASFRPKHPTDAAHAGIAFVHQELNLFPNLSIAENIFLTSFPRAGLAFIARRRLRERTAELLREVGLNISPDTLVEQLPAGERQLVEIARALSLSPKLVILDEPTSSLTVRETEALFALLQRLRERGVAMIYISHILGEVLRLCDDIVVLRDGKVVGSGARSEFDGNRMISLMVGRSLNQLYPKRIREKVPCPDEAQTRESVSLSPQRGEGRGEGWERKKWEMKQKAAKETQTSFSLSASVQCTGQDHPSPSIPLPVEGRGKRGTSSPGSDFPLLELRGVTQPHIVRDVSFALERGEVLGISGLMGAGRSELARIIFGLDPYQRGEILLAGRPLPRSGPCERIQHGIAFVTEDRHHEGLCLEASIADNTALAALRRHTRTPLKFINRASWRGTIQSIRDAVKLSPNARDEQPVKTLSGGNQQKVVLGKWLMTEPQLFIFDEPTRGIDVGAKFEIYQLIHRLADGGAGVLLISSEMEELIGICDRILVMNRGEIRDELRASEFDRERMLRSALLDGERAACPPAHR